MQLISILLITVSILTLLSGAAVLFGSSKGDRVRSAWFFIATLFTTIWMVSIALFLVATPDQSESIVTEVNLTYVAALFIDVGLLGYVSWRQKPGRFLTFAFLIVGAVLVGFFIADPGLLYTEVILTNAGNSIVNNVGPFYIIYNAFLGLLAPAVIICLIREILKKRGSKRVKSGDLVLLIGFSLSSIVIFVFNLILTLWTWDLVWLGPLAVSITILSFYYTILRYRALNLSSRWLKILSYIVIIASAAVIYMAIFSIIFAAMFRGSTPSVEVIALNFIMILIVLLLIPAMNEINMFVRSLISNDQVDMVYIIKKLSKVTPQGVDLKELAAFLAEHMHFEYIGFLIDGQVYGSAPKKITGDGLRLVAGLGNPENGVWQEFDQSTDVWKKLDLSAVAALRNANGKTFGQVMVGKPTGKISFSRRDLVQVETIINLSAVIIDSKYHKKAR